MRKVTIIPLVSMFVAGGLALAGAGGGKPHKGAPTSVDRIHHQIAAKMLFDGLKLTADQKTALSAKLDEIRTAHESRMQDRPGDDPELVAAMTAARDEVYATGRISDATKQKLVDLHQAHRQSREAARDAGGRPDFKADIEKILTPEQVEYFKSFNPMKELGFGREGENGGDHDAGFHPDRARHGDGMPPIVDRIRTMSDEDYAAKKQELLDRVKKHLEAKGDADAQAQIDKLGAQLEIVRNGTPEDVAKLKGEFALPLILGEAGRREMGRRHEMELHVKLLLSPEFQALLQGKDPRNLPAADGQF
ncbi:MAG: Spy/CpxP family protein refolding chaperone [Acidobacteriota bacterium]